MKNVKVTVKNTAEKEEVMNILIQLDSSYQFGLTGLLDDEYAEVFASNCGDIESSGLCPLKFKKMTINQLRSLLEVK